MTSLTKARLATQNLEDKFIGYQDWAEQVLGKEYKDYFSDEYVRRAARAFAIFLENVSENADDVAEMRDLLEAMKAERIKTQTANLEYNAIQRAEARLEMFNEEINASIARLKPIEFYKRFDVTKENARTGVLCIGDEHYGTVIDMESLFGERVNVYNPAIFRSRMESLMTKIVDDKYSIADYDNLVVFDMGDAIQGVLRQSDLMKLQAGVIDSAIQYAEYISNWLVELSNQLEVPIEYISLGGNHCELRLLNGKKGDFPQENIGRVIREFVALRLANNPNITVAPYAECGFKTIQGVNILAYHGDDAKDDLAEINFWQDYHNIDIDILIMGHFHHYDAKSVGIGVNTEKEVIRCPSIVGIDDYSKRVRKSARAGAIFMMFEDGEKTWQRKYVLN